MSTPAGWYPDNEEPGRDRYWTGTEWTNDTQYVRQQAVQQPAYAANAQPTLPMQAVPQYGYAVQQQVFVVDLRPISGLGVTGFVLSLVFALGFASVIGLVFSLVAMRETAPGGPKKGRGLTVAGLVINIIGTVFLLFVWVLPFLGLAGLALFGSTSN